MKGADYTINELRRQQGRTRNDLLVVEKLMCLRFIRNYHKNGYYIYSECEVRFSFSCQTHQVMRA